MKGKTIIVTGGTGSFGKKFTEIILNHNPKKLIIFSRDELKQYEMSREIQDKRLRFFIGDVRDKERLLRAFDGVDYIVHAAALKQVPTAEHNPFECIKTNVLGAQNVIEAAIDKGIEKVIALSTDKAVNPINLYGASKLCSDKLFVAGNTYSTKTRFSCVRYGNVVGSRGSVIPLFQKQKETGTITITDPRMTRFWITLEQSVELVLKAFDVMKGGEIFVPKIPSMKIIDLAKAIAPDCKIENIGIRSGEKIHEVLIPIEDATRTIDCGDYFVIHPSIIEDARMDWGIKAKRSNLYADFTYASDTNHLWLTEEELKCLL